MPEFEVRDNSGAVWKNDKKQDGDNKPNATGRARIGGVEYYVSAWTKDGRNGKFQSLAFRRVDEVQNQQNHRAASNQNNQPQSDRSRGPAIDPNDIPF